MGPVAHASWPPRHQLVVPCAPSPAVSHHTSAAGAGSIRCCCIASLLASPRVTSSWLGIMSRSAAGPRAPILCTLRPSTRSVCPRDLGRSGIESVRPRDLGRSGTECVRPRDLIVEAASLNSLAIGRSLHVGAARTATPMCACAPSPRWQQQFCRISIAAALPQLQQQPSLGCVA